MTINDMIDAGIEIEGGIEIRKWDTYADDSVVLFKGYAWELNGNASYMNEDISYMYAHNNKYNMSILCFELAN